MGTYATTTSFSALIPNILAGNTTTADAAGAAALAAHIIRAESVVNSYISARYSLPFTTVPPILRTLSEDIASWFHIRGVSVQDGQRDNPWFLTYKEDLKMLADIRDGKTQMALTDGSAVGAISTTRFISSTQGYAQTFDLDTSTSWAVDTDRVDDIADGRE